MGSCKINFTEASDTLEYGIYQDLIERGVLCEELDYGYNVTNYAGMYCTDKNAKSCRIGQGDGIIEAEEVLECALDHEQYRQIVEGRLRRPLSWVLDDLDPATTFDAEIRERVQNAIDELKRIISAKGIEEGTEEYKKMLAAGLCWFVAKSPIDEKADKIAAIDGRLRKIVMDRFKKDGLGDFWTYLEKNGGLRLLGDGSKEYTALEALKNQEGECTENSKVLFAVLKMAGLQPVFIYEDLLREETKDPIVKKATEAIPKEISYAYLHMCIGIYINGKLRFLDPMLLNSDADYKHFTPLSLRQYLSMDYSNHGTGWLWKNDLDNAISNYTKAIEIDSKNAMVYGYRAYAWAAKGEQDKAIADFTKKVEINPKAASAYSDRGVVWTRKGELDRAIADHTQAIGIDSKDADTYYNRGIAFEKKGEPDKAIADYTRAIIVDSKYVDAYYNRGLLRLEKNEFAGAISDFSNYIRLTNIDSWTLSRKLTKKLNPFWHKDGNKTIADSFANETNLNIAGAEAFIIISYSLWENGSKEDAIDSLRRIETAMAVKGKLSDSTRKFFKTMLDAMPKGMQKDGRVKAITKSLREKLR